jgi:alpha-galactosidase
MALRSGRCALLISIGLGVLAHAGCNGEPTTAEEEEEEGTGGATVTDGGGAGGASRAGSSGAGGALRAGSSGAGGAKTSPDAAAQGGNSSTAGSLGTGGRPDAGGPLAATPPMGWNSWNKFGCDVSEKLIRETADAMVATGMKDAGYRFVNIDDCWQVSRAADGTIVADAGRFPSGMKALADYVHNKGLKLGVYSDRGTSTCAGRPGSEGHEAQDAKSYASWGVDYLKYDNCYATLDKKTQYQTMGAALQATARPIVYSICAWSFEPWMPSTGQLWRTTGDINATWGQIVNLLQANDNYAQYAAPGHWNDPDMLEVGNGLTDDEQHAHFALWAIVAAPLIAGNDLRSMSEATKAILTAPEIIAVDQDPAGVQGTRVAQQGDLSVWSKTLSQSGERAVALLNLSGTTASITAHWSDVGLGAGPASVRDLWARADLGSFTDSYTASVRSHAAVVVKIAGQP